MHKYYQNQFLEIENTWNEHLINLYKEIREK